MAAPVNQAVGESVGRAQHAQRAYSPAASAERFAAAAEACSTVQVNRLLLYCNVNMSSSRSGGVEGGGQ